jgi:PTS system nitrogen regulatory IIA component
MGNETMTLDQLAAYLQRDQREVTKLASRGYLPGQKVGGQWRFARAEINHWLETQMHAYTEPELARLEQGKGGEDSEPLISTFLSVDSIGVPLLASTRASVLKEMVRLAEQTYQVYDPDAILEAVRSREGLASTALDNGVAIPHPHRPLAAALGDSVIAYGRSESGVPFGAPRGCLTDMFFLVCCRDDRTHLRVLARLSRLLLRPDFLAELRSAASPSETWETISAAEQDLISV